VSSYGAIEEHKTFLLLHSFRLKRKEGHERITKTRSNKKAQPHYSGDSLGMKNKTEAEQPFSK